jgi:phage pi2 protein 07
MTNTASRQVWTIAELQRRLREPDKELCQSQASETDVKRMVTSRNWGWVQWVAENRGWEFS